jgi:hypothetical protein
VRAVWISAVVHGVGVVIAGREGERGVLARMERKTIAIEIVAPTVEERAPAPLVAPAPTPAAAAASVSRARSQRRVELPSEATEPTAPGPSAPATHALAMRGMRHDLAVTEETAERIASGGGSNRATEQPVEPRWAHDPKIKLQPEPGGRHVVRDPVATFNVARDGTIDIHHRPEFELRFNLPTPKMLESQWRWFKKDFNRWLADPYRDTRVGKSQDLPNHLLAVPGMCEGNGPGCVTERDQRRQWEMEDEGLAVGDGIVGGRANIGDYLMRKLVGDPYASRKLKILDQTRDERIRIGAEYRAEQLDRSAELVKRNLDRAWAATTDPAARRAALFTIWDVCDEGEDERGAAGERARAMVIGFIRHHLPEGSAGAFSADETARLDGARSSRQHFVPYAR